MRYSLSFSRSDAQTIRGKGLEMTARTPEQRAISMLDAFERAGKSVCRVIVDGRRIELELSKADDDDEFERIDMRHGKT